MTAIALLSKLLFIHVINTNSAVAEKVYKEYQGEICPPRILAQPVVDVNSCCFEAGSCMDCYGKHFKDVQDFVNRLTARLLSEEGEALFDHIVGHVCVESSGCAAFSCDSREVLYDVFGDSCYPCYYKALLEEAMSAQNDLPASCIDDASHVEAHKLAFMLKKSDPEAFRNLILSKFTEHNPCLILWDIQTCSYAGNCKGHWKDLLNVDDIPVDESNNCIGEEALIAFESIFNEQATSEQGRIIDIFIDNHCPHPTCPIQSTASECSKCWSDAISNALSKS